MIASYLMVKGPSSPRTPGSRSLPITSSRVLIQGVGLEIHPTLHAVAIDKASRLLRRDRRIIRLRIDFEQERARHCSEPAIASGRIEIRGSDLVARAVSTTLSTSLDQLIAKLDRMLRERTKRRVNRRNDRAAGAEFRDQIAPGRSPSLNH